MMTCKNCGSELGNAKFCPNCGASISGEMPAATYAGVPVGADVRQRSIADMQHMISYFGAKEAQYAEFDKVSEEVQDRSSRGFGGWIVASIVSLLIGIFSEAFFFYIAAAAMVAGFIFFRKQNKNKLAIATARQEELANELQDHYDAYGYCSIGFEYTAPATLATLYDYIRKGRVTTPGDAINQYLADLDSKRMMELQEQATQAAQESAEYAKQTAKNTKKIARTSRKGAIYSGASFWFK